MDAVRCLLQICLADDALEHLDDKLALHETQIALGDVDGVQDIVEAGREKLHEFELVEVEVELLSNLLALEVFVGDGLGDHVKYPYT